MEQIDKLFEVDPNSWIEALQPYQRNMIKELYAKNGSYEETAKAWLTAALSTTVPFGTEKGHSVFFEKILTELELFLDGDEKYKNDQVAILQEKGAVQTYVVGAISVALSPALGAAATFLAPVIAIVFVIITKMGINAWLAMRKEGRSSADAAENNSNN